MKKKKNREGAHGPLNNSSVIENLCQQEEPVISKTRMSVQQLTPVERMCSHIMALGIWEALVTRTEFESMSQP